MSEHGSISSKSVMKDADALAVPSCNYKSGIHPPILS